MNNRPLINTYRCHHSLKAQCLHLIELYHFGEIFKALFISKVKPSCNISHYLNLNANPIEMRLFLSMRVYHYNCHGQPNYPVDPQNSIVFILIS